MADAERPFVITVRRRWLLLILPIIALAYFAAVVLLIILDYRVKGVSQEMLALGGVGLFLLVILIEFPFFLRRRTKRVRAPKPAKAKKDAPAAAEEAPLWDDDVIITDESQQGLHVLEYSAPGKSRNRNSVYTKTYVPVTGAHVVRVETLVADASDI